MKRSIFCGIKSIHAQQCKISLFSTVFSVPGSQLILLIRRPFHACESVFDRVPISRTTYSKQHNALRNQDVMTHVEEIIAIKDTKKRTECMNDLTKRVIDCSNTPIILHLLHCSSKKRLKMTMKNIEDVTVALRNDKKILWIDSTSEGFDVIKKCKL